MSNDLYAPFNQTFSFMTPRTGMNKTLHPDVDHLLHSNPAMSCLQAGSSELAQATFKMMRNTNMMRFGANRASEKAEDHYTRLRNEMLDRKRIHLQQVEDHKQAVLDAKTEKKRIQ